VTFRYDQSGRIDVEAVEQRAGKRLPKETVPYEEPDLEAIKLVAPSRDIVFALDVSGSMRAYQKIERARQGVIENARDLIQAGGGQIRVGAVAFGSQAEVICPLTSDLQMITKAVSSVSTYGTTAMGAGLNLALDLLSESGAGVVREIVLVSDGMPDVAQEAIFAATRAETQGIRLCLLGIGHAEVNEAFLNDMSPHYLVIESAEGIGQAISNFLTQAAPAEVLQSGITWAAK
jgi:Mg-chelatase subunit ChlD